MKQLKSTQYFQQHAAASKCQITSHLLSRITGTILVNVEKDVKKSPKKRRNKKTEKGASDSDSGNNYDEQFPPLETFRAHVGLDMKSNKKNLEVRGYTSKRDGWWHYSHKAIDLVRRE